LADAAEVRIDVVDLAGRVVSRLGSGRYSAGTHSLDWDGRGEAGALAPGLYFARVRDERGYAIVRMLALMR
jgi:flagellar hook assembly protein FlgD